MGKSSTISKAKSYMAIGDFWDSHDLSDYWDQTKSVQFDVAIESEETYCAVEKDLSEEIAKIARKRGVSSDTLINLWLQEKIRELESVR